MDIGVKVEMAVKCRTEERNCFRNGVGKVKN